MANNLRNSFNKTSLDISDVRPAGGPTRTNASNVLPRGTRAKENPGSLTKGGQPLKLKDGSDAIFELSRYTPTKTYLQEMSGIDPINSDSPSNTPQI
tara:strand:+ start:452 stop:742 length:291 start_codon:yes stop_codon:yes gene_type:complete